MPVVNIAAMRKRDMRIPTKYFRLFIKSGFTLKLANIPELGQSERHHIIPLLRTEFAMAARADDDVLTVVEGVGHRGGLGAGGERIFPAGLPGPAVERTEVAIHGRGDEDEISGGDDGAAEVDGAPFFGVGVFSGVELVAEGYLPRLGSGAEVDTG